MFPLHGGVKERTKQRADFGALGNTLALPEQLAVHLSLVSISLLYVYVGALGARFAYPCYRHA
jgi:hypothetical protein